jgi:hypothetical protein
MMKRMNWDLRISRTEDLKRAMSCQEDCQEDSQGISHFQLGNERDHCGISKTARRAVEASRIARWAEMRI